MALTGGTRLGVYEVVGLLGAGGMGEVYRARDTKLNRDVAIKVLPEQLATDAERLARFTREAQTLAALNHPNIAAIYGIEDNAIVMELVEGDDLSHHISLGAMSVTTALAMARQIIDALEAAHDLGIVHRDLKPANIKVRDDGTVKVLDFGLAKALGTEATEGDGGRGVANSPTLTARATQMGMILGTAAYMSPEQARGRAVDKRTDVWAFGCVLYEMLTGSKTFEGEDATEIISSVVKSEPNWNALPASVPAHVRTIITSCLVKDRKARIPDLSVVRYMLDGTMPVASAPVAEAPTQRSSRLWQAATAVLVLTTLAAGAMWYRAATVRPAVTRFVVAPPENLVFTGGPRPFSTVPAISPDGRAVAFTAQDPAGKRLLFIRPIDSLTAQPLAGTEGAAFPFWSPDSRSIGYSIVGKLMKVAVAGGAPSTLCTLNPGITSRGGAWSRDGVIIFNNGPAPLYRVPESGGAAVVMGTLPEGQTGRQFPEFLPDGRHFLFHATGTEEKSGVSVGSLDNAETTRVFPASTGAIYDPQSGHVLFVRQGTLLAQKFDDKTFAVSGDPIPVAERVESAVVQGVVAFSLSDTGVLAYGIGEASTAGTQLTWVDRTGKVSGSLGVDAQYRGISLKPDGSQVAAHRHDGDGGDIWVTDVSDGRTKRLTLDATQENASPVWSPEGKRIAFASTRDGKLGISVMSTDTGEEQRLFDTSAAARFVAPVSWSHDGRAVLFMMPNPTAPSTDLWIVPVSGERKAIPVLQSTFSELHGQYSPDGRWLAYTSNETGPSEVYVQPAVPGGGGKSILSTGGGNAPRWRGDSRELFYVAAGKMWSVDVSVKGTTFVAGPPKALFDHGGLGTNSLGHAPHFSYAVSGDGKRFLVSTPRVGAAASAAQSPIVVVTNWLDGIRK